MYTAVVIVASAVVVVYFIARAVLAWLFPKDAS
jgi:hypothetical protein